MSENDKYYIERCLDGHPDDFRYIVRRYQGVLLAHLAGKLGSRDKAEEAAQESFVRAYFNGLLQYEQAEEPGFVLFLAAWNRRPGSERKSKKRNAPPTEGSYPFVLSRSRRPGIVSGLRARGGNCRDYGGRSCSEVAQQLDLPLGTVTKTLSRAYAMLRKSLQQPSETENCEVQK